MKKYILLLVSLFLVLFLVSSCASRSYQPLPKGEWKCDELQAYFIETGYGQYMGIIGEEKKAFQMKIPVYGNECDFYYQDDLVPFLKATYIIQGNQMTLYQDGKKVYIFYKNVDSSSDDIQNLCTGVEWRKYLKST